MAGESRTIRGVLTILFALSLLIALEVFSRLLLEGSVADGPRQMVQVSIPEGAGVAEVAKILRHHDLIEHPILFRYAVRIMRADTRIQAGNMMLASGQSLIELVRSLTRAKAVGIPITFREGLVAAEVASLLQSKLGLDSLIFMSVVGDSEFVASLGLEAATLEGYLFPDTYFLAPGSDPRRIAARMVANFRSHLPVDFADQCDALRMTQHEVLTLASIIEWETFAPREARTISSVYHNRLRRGMLLQADPTIAYAMGKGPSRLYYSDLKLDSPYNTYLHPGLPPGPINNPGRRSIDAALNPEVTNYLYFVARGDGTHAFSSNLADHLAAKQQLDKLRRDAVRADTAASG